MKLTQSTIFHTKTELKEEIKEFILQIIPNPFNNPDYYEIDSQDKQSIGIKQIKEMIAWIQNRPFQEESKLAVIFEADKMTLESQNSILKVLEEPPAKSYIFLVTRNPKSLLPTILSRTNLINPRQGRKDQVSPEIDINPIFNEVPQEWLQTIDNFLKIKNPKERKRTISSFLGSIHSHIIEGNSPKGGENLELIAQTERALNANTNMKLILENLFFNFKRD
ncbi:hypothetical protein JW978_01850 [Candidatus Dojkabacteria bacterium]|nr:hypothetical protein [Candidatus Dojkabacteria bacterium]